MTKRMVAVGLWLLVGCISRFGFGQTSPDLQVGLTPYGSFHGSRIDKVSLQNGNVLISIPLFALPQRGDALKLSFSLIDNNKLWTTAPCSLTSGGTYSCPSFTQCASGFNCSRYWTTSGSLSGINLVEDELFRVHSETTDRGQTYAVTVIAPDGAIHPMGVLSETTSAAGVNNPHIIAESVDGTSIRYDGLVVHQIGNIDTLTTRDGVKIMFTDGGTWTMQDTNGNQITLNSTGVYTDTLGRTVSSIAATDTSHCIGPRPISYAFDYNVPAPNGQIRQFLVCSVIVPLQTNFGVSGVAEYSGGTNAIQSVVLPDGTSWTFEYDSRAVGDPSTVNYGQLTKITLPSGGNISYTWGVSHVAEGAAAVSNTVASRTVDFKDGSGPHTWTYNFSAPGPSGPLTATVTDPPVNGVVYSTVTTLSKIFNGIPVNAFYETSRNTYAGTTLEQTVTTDYATPNFSSDVFPIRTTTTWPDGQSTKQETDYDAASFLFYGSAQSASSFPVPTTPGRYGIAIAKRAFDYFVQGTTPALLQQKTRSYVWQANPSYVTSNLVDLQAADIVKDGAGCTLSETDYAYDESSYLTGTSISTGHVTPNGLRGNLTSTTEWLAPTSACSPKSGSAVTRHTNWYDTGQLYQSIDPLGHATTRSYDPFYIGAYSTQTCSPTTNGVQHCVSGTYDFNTGLLTTFTNENATTQSSGNTSGDTGHTTIYSYDAATLRLAGITSPPDPGNSGVPEQATFTYSSPNVFPVTLKRQRSITPGTSDSITTTFDGLGRPYRVDEAMPAGLSTEITQYDPLDQVLSVTNPYFSTSDPTYGVTLAQYDAFGRVTQVSKQDGSLSTTDYSQFPSVTTTDPAGNQRISRIDGLGRLVEVDEPGGPDPGTQATASVTISGAFNSTWVSPGSPHLAATGTAIASVTMSDGSSHDFYFDTNQHLCQMSWFSGSGWYDQDLTSMTEAGLPLAGSSVAAAVLGGVIHVFYQAANLHIYDMNWTGSVWQNVDMTVLTGASAMSGTKMSTVLTGGPNSPMMFYEGTDQHLYTVYWNGSATAWQNVDMNSISGATTLMAVKGSLASVMYSNNTVIYLFYIGANQHLIAILWNGSAWVTGDVTTASGAGGVLPVTGSALTSISTVGGTPLMNFYEGPSQHIYGIYWSNAANAWQSLDFTSFTGATNVAAALAALSNDPSGPQAFYLGNNQHLDDINWNGSAWVNSDLTSLSGSTVVAAVGSSLSSHGTSGGNTSNIFFEGTNQHIYHTYYSPTLPGWVNEDPLTAASNFDVDSGTVSLTVGSYSATVCYGASINPVCAGKPVNASSSDITNALAAALNATGSPVTAAVTNSTTLNLTWRTPGVITTAVAAMISTSDYPSLFPSGSFTSTSASFSGGIAASNQSLRNPFVTQYQYDGLGNMLRVDQKGSASTDSSQWRTRAFTYDSLSRLLTATNPESGTITYLYDADGELLMKTSPAPNQTGSNTQFVSYCYDEQHRPTKRDYQFHVFSPPICPITAPIVTYAYDSGTNAKGRLTGLVDQAGTAAYGYDILGRLTTETRTLTVANNPVVTKSLSYGYNLDGSLKTLTYPSTATVTYTPDSAGRPASAVDVGNQTNYVAGATYGPDNALTGFISGGAITNKFLYTPRLQPCRMVAAAGGTLPISCTDTNHGNVLDLGYDFHAGNGTAGSGMDNGTVYAIINYKDTNRNQTFTYDALNRLTSAQNGGTNCGATVVNGKTAYWGNSYGYDAWGNLLRKTITKCSAENLVLTALANNELSGYGYDAAGNMIHDATSGLNYSYDQENRIVGTNGYTYTYDGNGNRIAKSNGSTGTLYWYMTPGIVGESDLLGAMKSEYVFFDGERVARRDLIGPPSVVYYFSDHLKTASVITDPAGNLKTDSDYYPWGGELQFVANDSNHYKFTGKERDTESGLDYFGARYYSNALGRFITPDWSPTPEPIPYADLFDPQSLNQYSYVRNLPTTRIDEDGHDPADPQSPTPSPSPSPSASGLSPGVGPSLPPNIPFGPGIEPPGVEPPGVEPGEPSSPGAGVVIGIFLAAKDAINTMTKKKGEEIERQKKERDRLLAENARLKKERDELIEKKKEGEQGQAEDVGHTKNKRRSTKNKHEKRRSGKSHPPNYKPHRKHRRSKEDKKKDEEQVPYHRKDRDSGIKS